MEYPLPRGNVKKKDLIRIISEALYPAGDTLALNRVSQAFKDGQKNKKNRLPEGNEFYDKDFFEWAVIRWPELPDKLEGFPVYVKTTSCINVQYDQHSLTVDDPEDVELLVERYIRNRLLKENKTGDFIADLKRAYVISELECSEKYKEIKTLKEENASLRDQLSAKQKKEDERLRKASNAGKRGGRGNII